MVTEERQKMIQEEANARRRKDTMEQVMAKVKVGQLRTQKRREEEELDRLRNLRYHVRLRNRQNNSAETIQRYYRGHIGRRAAGLWREHTLRKQASHALYLACSTTISRHWRGYKGRQDAGELRRAMAEFILAMRQIDLDAELETIRKKKKKKWYSLSLRS